MGWYLESYGDIRLLNGDFLCIGELDVNNSEWKKAMDGATHIRACLPSTDENRLGMKALGYFLADQTLAASISLEKPVVDFQRFIRPELEISVANQNREEVRKIAQASFPTDSRFHIVAASSSFDSESDRNTASQIISSWVDRLDEWFSCSFRGKTVGFLVTTYPEPGKAFVHLAAVLKEYRLSGAGPALYAKTAMQARQMGMVALDGRISAGNTSVKNLYSKLGASFSNPTDVFLKMPDR